VPFGVTPRFCCHPFTVAELAAFSGAPADLGVAGVGIKDFVQRRGQVREVPVVDAAFRASAGRRLVAGEQESGSAAAGSGQ